MPPVVKSYTSWQPLEEVVVGRVFTPDHFGFIKDRNVLAQLSQMLDETNEDLDNLQKVIEQYGARVRRPTLPDVDAFRQQQLYSNHAPIPPLTPRDWQITFGEKLLRILPVPEMNDIIQDYSTQQPGSVIELDHPHVMDHAIASCIVRVGQDVFFDRSEWLTDAQMEWVRDHVLDSRYRVHRAVTNGHGDAVFAILRPGVIISSMHDEHINYQENFPGWEVHRVEEASVWAAMEIGKFRADNFNGRWWLQGRTPSAEFSNFINTYLKKWTGFVQETVFDVNCLVLDEHNVIFSSYNKQSFDFCRRHRIEPIICELRHKYIFDCGISCSTQDIRRRGELEKYL